MLVAHTGGVVEATVARPVVAYVGHAGSVGDRVFPAVWGQHLLSGHTRQAEGTDSFEGSFLIFATAIAAMASVVIAVTATAVAVTLDGSFAHGAEHADGGDGASEGIFLEGLSAVVADLQTGSALVGSSSGLRYTTTGHSDCQVVFLLVEVAGSVVHANVARATVADVVHAGVVGGGVVTNGVVAVDLSGAGSGHRRAEDEAFVGGCQSCGVVLLVAVTGNVVGADVAVGAVKRATDVGVVLGALVQDGVTAVVLHVEYCGTGTCADLQQFFQGRAFWWRRVVTVTTIVTMIIAACLSRHCHYCCKCENQWFESHCSFHGVSPSCLLVG